MKDTVSIAYVSSVRGGQEPRRVVVRIYQDSPHKDDPTCLRKQKNKLEDLLVAAAAGTVFIMRSVGMFAGTLQDVLPNMTTGPLKNGVIQVSVSIECGECSYSGWKTFRDRLLPFITGTLAMEATFTHSTVGVGNGN